MSDKTGSAQIGVVGMAVMGSNLARNFASKGFKTAIFNRTYAKTEAVVAAQVASGRANEGEGTASIYTFNAGLKKRLALFAKK